MIKAIDLNQAIQANGLVEHLGFNALEMRILRGLCEISSFFVKHREHDILKKQKEYVWKILR